MQFWKLIWGRNSITTKRQWAENELLETESDFIGFYGSVTKTTIEVQGKQLCISFSKLWPEPCIGNLCCTSHIAFYWGPSKSLPLLWIWASVEARQTGSFHSFMTEIVITGYFASDSSSSHAFFYATVPESHGPKVSTFYAPRNIFLCPLSTPTFHSTVPVRLRWHCVGIVMMHLCHLHRHVMIDFCVVLMWKFTLCSGRCTVTQQWRRKECIMNWRNRIAACRMEDF